MVRKFEVLLVIVAIVLLTLFSASFADPTTTSNHYDRQGAFYGRDILKKSSVLSFVSDSSSSDYDAYFWGIPDFSHQ